MPRGNSTMSGPAAQSAAGGTRPAKSRTSRATATEKEGMMSRCLRETNEMIEQNPATCMAVTLGVGFAIGMAIGMASGSAFGSRHVERSAIERFGRRMLDAMHDALPESIARRVG